MQFAVTSVTPPLPQLLPVLGPGCQAMPWGPSSSLISKENVNERHRDARETEKETEVTERQRGGKSERQREKGLKKVKRRREKWNKEMME